MMDWDKLRQVDTFWYLGSPYSKYPDGIEAAYQQACRAAAFLARKGVPVHCPIAHTHGIAIHGEIDPRDHDFWMEVDKPFLEAASGLIVCEMESWHISLGLTAEIERFKQMGKPIERMPWPYYGSWR